MEIPHLELKQIKHLNISRFREMDFLSIEKYKLPIELMMENAGLQLAKLISLHATVNQDIIIGVGKGNNGGGGLVAARRLLAMGFKVKLDVLDKNLNPLALIQMERAMAFGAEMANNIVCDVFVDAYLGFSQKLPLSSSLSAKLRNIQVSKALKISLDLPTGFNPKDRKSGFKPDIILTMAAMKTELIPLLKHTQIYIADLGIPAQLYSDFGIEYPEEFRKRGIVLVKA